MKNGKSKTLGILALLGGTVGFLGKSKATKIVGFGTAAVSAAFLLKEMFKEELKTVDTECQEVEQAFEDAGVDPEKVEDIYLLTGNEEGPVEFGRILFREAYRQSIFPDEMLEYNSDAYLHTLHIMQNVEKNRVIISIPLPRKTKGGLNSQDIRDYFKEVYEEFIEEHKLDMQVFLNQIGVLVTEGTENPPYTYYELIERHQDETFREYLDRITSLREEYEPGVQIKGVNLYEGEKILRIEHYLNLEFPVFPAHSNKKGLDLLTSMKLIKLLTEPTSIKAGGSGRDVNFELDRIAFHPTDDYGEIYTIKGGVINVIGL